MRVTQLPEHERPRERLMKSGAENLSAQELLAILLVSGTAKMPVLQLAHNLLKQFSSLKKLSEATIEELMQVDGIGEAKAIQLKACFALGLRAHSSPINPKEKISQPQDAYALIKDRLEGEKQELLMVILQDVKSKLIKSQVVTMGTINRTLVHPREVFYPAIRHKASTMILAHNHPSGDPTPSKEDYAVTDTLVEVGKMVGIPIVDHIIVGAKQYVSLRERGYRF